MSSEAQIRLMLDSLKHSKEPHELVIATRKVLQKALLDRGLERKAKRGNP